MGSQRNPQHPDAMALDRRSPLPLWAQLVTELERRLASGAFSSRFPTDRELTETYGVSRQTAREAVRRLSASVALDRQAGRGTFLRPAEFEQPAGTLYSLFQAIEAQGVEQRSLVRVQELRHDPDAAADLELPADAPLIYLERLRLAGGLPLALDRTWLPADLAGALLEADFGHTALYEELRVRCGVRPTRGEERIQPVVPGRAQARLLQISAGGAAFSIQRHTWSGERPLERRLTLVHGERYAFVTTWSPSAPKPAGARLALVAG
ncbi:MAG: GntR family transcriptional regulator [Actinomycetota bacterium]